MQFANSVSVLGEIYTIRQSTPEEDPHLKECDGYCDKTTRGIVIVDIDKTDCNLHNKNLYIKKVLRHEIIHAFLFESGLHENINPDNVHCHDEQMVDWFAIQGPKIFKAWQEVGCIG